MCEADLSSVLQSYANVNAEVCVALRRICVALRTVSDAKETAVERVVKSEERLSTQTQTQTQRSASAEVPDLRRRTHFNDSFCKSVIFYPLRLLRRWREGGGGGLMHFFAS